MKIAFKKIRPKKLTRLLQISTAILIIGIIFYFILFTFAENISFFYSPSEILAFSQTNNIHNNEDDNENKKNDEKNNPKINNINSQNYRIYGKELKVGGKVSSIIKEEEHTCFLISDNKNAIKIKYKGVAPALMQEGIEIVAAGKLIGEEFMAHQILIKHDERYYPKK